jgi:hypothetical protein
MTLTPLEASGLVGQPPKRQERSLVSLPDSTASVVGVCRSPRRKTASISGLNPAADLVYPS